MSTSQVENRIHNGRGVTGYVDQDGEHVLGWPEIAYEALRALNHLTTGGVMPAPLVHEILGHLQGVGHLLPQALTQLGNGLARSLDAEGIQVFDHDGDPTQNVERACALLAQAAGTAASLGALLDAAQSAIASQGYNNISAS